MLPSDTWEQVPFPSGDVTVTKIKGNNGKLFIFNIYIDSKSDNTIKTLTTFHNGDNLGNGGSANSLHVLWVGDFNRHHPYWDNPSDTRLFTSKALNNAKILIKAVADAGLELALSSGLPTHVHNVTKKWTRLDQVFLSDHSTDLLTMCTM